MSERRAVPRVPLTVPATIYAGETVIRCNTRDISPLGVAVAGFPGSIPAKALRLRLSASEKTPSVLCDCFPVGRHPGPGDTWGLQFLNPTGDLPVSLQKFVEAEIKGRSEEIGSQEAPRASQTVANCSDDSGRSEAAEFERQLQDLYREALESLD